MSFIMPMHNNMFSIPVVYSTETFMKTLGLFSPARGGVALSVEGVGLVGIWGLPEESKDWVSKDNENWPPNDMYDIVYNNIYTIQS